MEQIGFRLLPSPPGLLPAPAIPFGTDGRSPAHSPAIGDRVTRTIPLLLIVDDDAAVAGILTSDLTEAGFEAVRAEIGQEGLELFKRCRPDLVLTDDVMPRLSGPCCANACSSPPARCARSRTYRK